MAGSERTGPGVKIPDGTARSVYDGLIDGDVEHAAMTATVGPDVCWRVGSVGQEDNKKYICMNSGAGLQD